MNHRLQTSLSFIKRLASHEFTRFFGLGVLLALLLTPGNLSFDTERRLQVTRWMWTGESQVRPDDTFFLNLLPGKGGQPMAQFGIGQSLVMLPADVISHAIFGSNMTPLKTKLREMVIYYLTFPLITGLALVQARRVCGWLLPDPRRADFSTLIFALCTSFLVYSRDTQENMLMNLCVLGGIWHGLNWSRNGSLRHAAAMAAFLGFLILIRISTIAVIFPLTTVLGLFALRNHWKANRRQLLIGIVASGAILATFVLIDRLYHWHRFGEFTRTYAYYMIEQAKLSGYGNNYPMGNPFWNGISSFAFDSRKAAFLFDPMLFAAAIMLLLPLRDGHVLRPLLAASFSALVLTACLYAGSNFWHGDASWGPRHLNVAIMPTVLFGIIATVSYLGDHVSSWFRTVFRTLLTVGFALQILSLPLFHELEVDQWKAGYPVSFPPALRALNLVATAQKNPQLWGLDCVQNERIHTLQSLPLQFAPFQIAAKMPGSLVSKALVGIWCAALVGLVIWLGVWFARAASDCRAATAKPSA